MKQRNLIFLLLLLFHAATAQQKNSFKFDFGGADGTAEGYTLITNASLYSDARGYGFLNTEHLVVKSTGPKGKKKNIASDYITSDKPFFFSVKIPEGNYDVTVTLGDQYGTSANTVRAECRRLFINNLRTKRGEIKTVTFTVHVKDSIIRDANGHAIDKVRLKPREVNYFHWDDQLTLEFTDSAVKVGAVEITPNTKAATIFLAGNSTVVDQDHEPWASWGQMIPAFFEPQKVCIANYAESGESLSSFISEHRLQKVLSLVKPGDYLFIEFGHNDQKQKGEGIGPFTSYKRDLKFFISEIKRRGGTPVLVTSMNRRSFDSLGHIVNTLGDYPEAVRQTGKEENVAVIDLNTMSKVLYEAWGPEQSVKAFVHYPANTFPGQDKKLEDNTHFNTYGAYEIARCIVYVLQEQQLPVSKFLKKGIPVFNPAKPDAVSKWYWPQSVLMAAVKPEGS